MSLSKPQLKTNSAVQTRPPASAKAPMKPRQQRRLRGLAGFYRSCLSALQSLRANKTRSLLTSLGIIIGVGAVIMIVSIAESSTDSINSRLSTLNPAELIIRSGSATSGGVRGAAGSLQTLTQADADAIASQVPNVSAVKPVANAGRQGVFQNPNWFPTLHGVYPSHQQIRSWQVA